MLLTLYLVSDFIATYMTANQACRQTNREGVADGESGALLISSDHHTIKKTLLNTAVLSILCRCYKMLSSAFDDVSISIVRLLLQMLQNAISAFRNAWISIYHIIVGCCVVLQGLARATFCTGATTAVG